MMRGFLKLLVLAPLALVLVVLGVANRQPVALQLDPFAVGADGLSITLPLFVLFFVTLSVGAVIGYGAGWLAQGKNRKERRAFKRECERLSRERDSIKAALPATAIATLSRP